MPYTGLGAGAHSALVQHEAGRVRTNAEVDCRRWNAEDVGRYLEISDFQGEEHLSEQEVRIERLMLGLRTSVGVPEKWLPGDRVRNMVTSGSLQRFAGTSGESFVRIPEDHFFVSDDIICMLIE